MSPVHSLDGADNCHGGTVCCTQTVL